MPEVNPNILVWARETAGLSVEEAARGVQINDARGKTGAERLAELEAGETVLSRPLLVRMSKKYRRPLLVFYLDHPPRKGYRGEDFRTLPGALQPSDDATLDALIRDIRTRQNLVRSMLEDDESSPLKFVGSANIDGGRDRLVSAITQSLDFRREEFCNQGSIGGAFSYLREKIENAGILVLLIGNLGSYHSNIPIEIFRGFAIADPLAPFVVINDQDAKAAWSFTALHEVAHLWLGLSGVSGPYGESRVERFCNEVAGEILLPSSELGRLAQLGSSSYESTVDYISEFARNNFLSRSMVAYRLFQFGSLQEAVWKQMADQFRREWLAFKSKRDATESKSGGPNYYVVKRHRLGQSLLNLVSRALGEGIITHTKAGKVLGVKPRNVEPLLRDISTRGRA